MATKKSHPLPQTVHRYDFSGFPVVNDMDNLLIIGYITRKSLQLALAQGLACQPCNGGFVPGIWRFVSGRALGPRRASGSTIWAPTLRWPSGTLRRYLPWRDLGEIDDQHQTTVASISENL